MDFLIIILIILTLLPIIPSHWGGLSKVYFDSALNQWQKHPNISILSMLFTQLWRALFFEIIVSMGVRGTASLIAFIVIGVDVYFNKGISNNSVLLISIAIIALYMDKLIETGKHIKFFKILEWESKDQKVTHEKVQSPENVQQ